MNILSKYFHWLKMKQVLEEIYFQNSNQIKTDKAQLRSKDQVNFYKLSLNILIHFLQKKMEKLDQKVGLLQLQFI